LYFFKYNKIYLQKSIKTVSFRAILPTKRFGFPTALAPIEMESPERPKPMVLASKERPTEAPFGA